MPTTKKTSTKAKSTRAVTKTTPKTATVSLGALETKVFDPAGAEQGTMTLPGSVFGLPWNADLVHQVIHSMRSNARMNVADTKGRGEVRGGGKKPWRQKGTGRARHGSSRSPIWRGGGATHGPTSEENYKRKINKKMKLKALYTILSAKLKDGEIICVNQPDWKTAKAKGAGALLKNLTMAGYSTINYDRGRRVLIALPTKNEIIEKSFSNIKSARVEEARNLNPLLLLTYKYVVLFDPGASVSVIEERAA